MRNTNIIDCLDYLYSLYFFAFSPLTHTYPHSRTLPQMDTKVIHTQCGYVDNYLSPDSGKLCTGF